MTHRLNRLMRHMLSAMERQLWREQIV